MKSREEQMMHHLKTCCPESMKVWEDIIEWKQQRKDGFHGSDQSNQPHADTNNVGKERPLVSATVTNIFNSTTGKTITHSRKVRRLSRGSSHVKGEAEDNSRVGNGSVGALKTLAANLSPVPGTTAANSVATGNPAARLSSPQHTMLTPTQLRYFHRVCTIAVASQKLDLSFFEDPVIVELFHAVRPGMVANEQLPKRHQFVGDRDVRKTKPGSIEEYAMEQVTTDLGYIVRSLKRYEGLKTSVHCPVPFKTTDQSIKVPSSKLVCGGELSCRIVPAMHSTKRSSSTGIGDSKLASRELDPAVALASAIEKQLRMTSIVLGRAVLGDEREAKRVVAKPGKVSGLAAQYEAMNDPDEAIECTGLSYIGSYLVTTTAMRAETESKPHPPGTIRRAHRLLALRWPMIHFASHGCLEEQLNLLLKDILTNLPHEDFAEPLEQASAAIRAVQRLEESPTIASINWKEELLQAVSETIVGASVEIDQAQELLEVQNRICLSSWTSAPRALAHLLRLKAAHISFARKFWTNEGFPSELRVFLEDDFWKKLELAENLMRPLERASLVFEPEKGSSLTDGPTVPNMGDMVHVFCSLFHMWTQNGCSYAAQRVERRWRDFEQPLMLLAFLLHPAYTHEAKAFLLKQTQDDGLFSVKYLSNAVLGYTIKYLASELNGDPPLSIPLLKRQASAYLDRIRRGEIHQEPSMQMMQDDWREYWAYQTSTPELSRFAMFVLSVTVQASHPH